MNLSRSVAQLLRLRRGGSPPLEIRVDGSPMGCFEGEAISTAIWSERPGISLDGMRVRGLWCGIGVCFECVVVVDGVAGVRACMTRVRPGMEVRTGMGPPVREASDSPQDKNRAPGQSRRPGRR
jgi:D-hydroxyproline dehydrogenase subunit gamma